MINKLLVIDALVYKKNKAFGYQEYLFNLLDYFFENRHQLKFEEIIILCEYSQMDDFSKYKQLFTINGFKVSNTLSRLIMQMFIPYLLHLKKNDVILFTGNYSSLIKKTKHVLVVHDLLYLRKKLFPNFKMRLQRKIYIPKSISLADIVIAISDFTKMDIIRNIKASSNKPVYKIYNYFNFKKYSTAFESRVFNFKYFLCVSSSLYHKNLITIIKAFEKYCFFHIEVDLSIVGSLGKGDVFLYYKKLSERVKQRIHFYSNISNTDLAQLYMNCEAYISASYFEGLGMPVVEAMFFNVPLILSDLEVFHEITIGNASFFNPNSYEDLFKILDGKNGKEPINTKPLVLKYFSQRNTSQKYIDLLNSL